MHSFAYVNKLETETEPSLLPENLSNWMRNAEKRPSAVGQGRVFSSTRANLAPFLSVSVDSASPTGLEFPKTK